MRKSKEQIMMEEIEERFYDWKNKYNNILQIQNLSNRNKTQQRKKLIEETQLIKDENGDLLISGGGIILLFLVKSFGKGWKEYLKDLKKRYHKDCYLEALQFLHRQKLFDIDLLEETRDIDAREILKWGER